MFHKSDITFIYDHSGSIETKKNFDTMIDFSREILTEFETNYAATYGDDGLKVAWAEYGSTSNYRDSERFHYDSATDAHNALESVKQKKWSSYGGTYTGDAM